MRFEVNVLRVLLFSKFGHSEGLTVTFDIVEHVRVLVAAQPLVFPVKPEGPIRQEQVSETLVSDIDAVDPVLACIGALLAMTLSIHVSRAHCVWLGLRGLN